MTSKAAVAISRRLPERARGPKYTEEAILHADEVVEERSLVVGLTYSAGDSSSFKIGVDGGIDFHKVVVSLEGFNEGAETQVSGLCRHID